MTTAISESSSIIRRGRPSRFDPKYLAIIRSLWPAIKSNRGIVNHAYAVLAFEALKDKPEFAWLVDRATNTIRWTYLELLGRIDNPEWIVNAATWICDEHPDIDFAREVVGRLKQKIESGEMPVAA